MGMFEISCIEFTKMHCSFQKKKMFKFGNALFENFLNLEFDKN